jgi:hypothetical protein
MAHEIRGSRAAEPFVHGFSRGLLVAAGIAFAGAIVAVTTVRSHATPSPARAAEPHLSRLRRLRRVADEGQSPTTPAILGGAVLLALIPVLLIALAVASVASHFAV